jgi:hypothetical protein
VRLDYRSAASTIEYSVAGRLGDSRVSASHPFATRRLREASTSPSTSSGAGCSALEWVVPALAARARRYMRTIDEALGGPPRQVKGPLVFDEASQRWIPETSVDRRHTRAAPEGRGPVEHRACGWILSVR